MKSQPTGRKQEHMKANNQAENILSFLSFLCKPFQTSAVFIIYLNHEYANKISFPFGGGGTFRKGHFLKEVKEEYWNYLYSPSVKLPICRRQYSIMINKAWPHHFTASRTMGKLFITLVSLYVKWNMVLTSWEFGKTR